MAMGNKFYAYRGESNCLFVYGKLVILASYCLLQKYFLYKPFADIYPVSQLQTRSLRYSRVQHKYLL
jgi:hypothetical protein